MHLGLMKHLICRAKCDVAQPEGMGTFRLPGRPNSRRYRRSRAETRKRELGPTIAPAQAVGSRAEPDPTGVAA